MKSKKIILGIFISLIALVFSGYVLYNVYFVASLGSIEIKDNLKNDDKMIMELILNPVLFAMDSNTWCSVSNDSSYLTWTKAIKNKCTLEVESTNYTIYLKNRFGRITKVASKDVKLNKIKNLNFNKENYYIPVKGNEKFDLSFEKYGIVNNDITYEVENEEIVKIEDGKFIGLKEGSSKVTAHISNKSITTNVYVLSSIVVPNIDTNSKKDYIPCNKYTEEQEIILDATLKDRVNTAGYQTRAGVVAAAIFLGLEFEHRIPYFFESGRLVNHSGIRHIDGEGRYYHEGLYLTEKKYETLEPGANFVGPKPWGCKLKNGTSKYGYTAGRMYPNGLDCSGFISWTLLNGGFDVGDVGAGDNAYRDDDLYDLGELRSVSMDLINSNEVKPGDLIAYWGHMAMIIDIDDNHIYIAESLPMTKGVVIKKYTKRKAVSIFVNIMLMDEVYKNDGNLDKLKWYAN